MKTLSLPAPFTGSLQISRVYSNARPDEMHLTVTDKTSGVQFLKIALPLEDLMSALTAHTVACAFELRGVDAVGLEHEHKTVAVPFDAELGHAPERKGLNDHERSPLVDAALAPFEVEGWSGSASDLFNHHRRDRKTGTQTVAFHRYVDPITGQPLLRP